MKMFRLQFKKKERYLYEIMIFREKKLLCFVNNEYILILCCDNFICI